MKLSNVFIKITTILIVIISLISFAITLSNNYLFIFTRKDLSNVIGIDCSNAEIKEIVTSKCKKGTNECDYGTQICVVLKDEDFRNNGFVKEGMIKLESSTDHFENDLKIEMEYVLSETETKIPNLHIDRNNIILYGYNLKDDVQHRYLGLDTEYIESCRISWFITEEDGEELVYVTANLYCKGIISFI